MLLQVLGIITRHPKIWLPNCGRTNIQHEILISGAKYVKWFSTCHEENGNVDTIYMYLYNRHISYYIYLTYVMYVFTCIHEYTRVYITGLYIMYIWNVIYNLHIFLSFLHIWNVKYNLYNFFVFLVGCPWTRPCLSFCAPLPSCRSFSTSTSSSPSFFQKR